MTQKTAMKKRALVTISYELLAQLLDLPEDFEVIGVIQESRNAKTGTVQFMVRGDGLSDSFKVQECGEAYSVARCICDDKPLKDQL